MATKVTVRPNGQTLTVQTSVSHWTTEALAVTASSANDVESTTVTKITSDYDMWFANTASTATVTVKQLDGTTLIAPTLNVSLGVGPYLLQPTPDPYQSAPDLDVHPLMLEVASGFATCPRYAASSSTTLTTQVLRGVSFTAPMSMSCGSVRVFTGATAAAATPSLIRVGLYTFETNGDMTLAASTASDTALLASTHTAYSKALSAPLSIVKGTRYSAAVLVVTAQTAPAIAANAFHGNAQGTASPQLCWTQSGQTDLPASVTAANQAVTSGSPYIELIPA